MANAIQLQMTGQGDTVKLSWTIGQFSRPYCVNKDRLYTASQKLRDTLQLIAIRYKQPAANYGELLPRLATEGENLKEALFSPLDGSSVEDLTAYLDQLPRGTPLTVFSDSTVQAPWNFVYATDPKSLRAPQNKLSDFEDFWLSRFKVRVRFIATDLPPSRPINRDRFKTLFALHDARFKSAKKVLEEFPELIPKIECLLNYKLGSTKDWDDCRSKWETMTNEDSVLYIFAHSDGKTLFLEETDKIGEIDKYKYELDTNGFSKLFKKTRTKGISNTLCFINGCRTADGDWGNGFLSVTSGPGFHGFIGSEAEISSDWATRYAVEFLYALLERGKSVDEAYEEVKESCFPMSLWYSCYAHPNFRIDAGVPQ